MPTQNFIRMLPIAWLVTALFSCGQSQSFDDAPANLASAPSTSSPFWIRIVSDGDSALKKRPVSASELKLSSERCSLYKNSWIALQGPPIRDGQHVLVNTKSMIPGCSFSRGYVYLPHVAESSTIYKNGSDFADFYRDNYADVRTKAREFWPNSYGCAAFASTALKLAGYPVQQVLITNELETQLIDMGWRPILDMSRLQAGDIVFTDKESSNIPGTFSHVYVFDHYADTHTAVVLDNYGLLTQRNLGAGSFSRSVLAYRLMPF